MTITLFGQASTPADNGANVTNPTVVTPPGSMLANDLVLLFAHSRATSGTLSMSQAGGQSWTSLTQHNTTTCRRRIFWCNFNGTWSANPSVTIGTTCNTVVMLVFRPTQGYAFSADQALTDAVVSAPGSPFTVTITGQTIASNSVCIAAWACIAANTWGTLTGTGWSKTSLSAQYRNTSGSDQTSSFAYFIGSGATGNVSQNESAGTAGATSILSFKETRLTYTLVAQDMAQAQTLEGAVLTQHNTLVVQGLAQAQTISTPTLTAHDPSVALVVQDLAQAQTINNVVLTQHNILVVDNLAQVQTINNVSLTQHNALEVQGLTQAQTISGATLTQHNALVVDNLTQVQTISGVVLTQHNVVTVSGLQQYQTINSPTLTAYEPSSALLQVQDLFQAQTISGVELVQHNVLEVQDMRQRQTVDNVTFGFVATVSLALRYKKFRINRKKSWR